MPAKHALPMGEPSIHARGLASAHWAASSAACVGTRTIAAPHAFRSWRGFLRDDELHGSVIYRDAPPCLGCQRLQHHHWDCFTQLRVHRGRPCLSAWSTCLLHQVNLALQTRHVDQQCEQPESCLPLPTRRPRAALGCVDVRRMSSPCPTRP
ncbi:hypothetical protein OAO87_03170 [bacterium]|nr:hypothetical protein [bacterium]